MRPTAPPPDPPAAASMYLGDMYRDGRGGLTKNEQEVARLYKLAADKGVADAQFRLGVFYEGSLGFAVYRIGRGGLPKDELEAARLYKLAGDQGLVAAQYNLGALY